VEVGSDKDDREGMGIDDTPDCAEVLTPRSQSATDCSSVLDAQVKGGGGKVRRSRTSDRDVQLGEVVANSRMEVAVKYAEMREASSQTVTKLNIKCKKDLMNRQEKIALRQLESAERSLRENNRSRETIEMTKLSVARSHSPAKAMKLAKEAVDAE
jgi:hypothetical protein